MKKKKTMEKRENHDKGKTMDKKKNNGENRSQWRKGKTMEKKT